MSHTPNVQVLLVFKFKFNVAVAIPFLRSVAHRVHVWRKRLQSNLVPLLSLCSGFASSEHSEESNDDISTEDGSGDGASSDTDDEAEKQETLQMKVMRIAKGMTIQDLLTPRRKAEKAKAEKAKADAKAMGVDIKKPLKVDPDGECFECNGLR